MLPDPRCRAQVHAEQFARTRVPASGFLISWASISAMQNGGIFGGGILTMNCSCVMRPAISRGVIMQDHLPRGIDQRRKMQRTI